MWDVVFDDLHFICKAFFCWMVSQILLFISESLESGFFKEGFLREKWKTFTVLPDCWYG